jgi:hypothetical protein
MPSFAKLQYWYRPVWAIALAIGSGCLPKVSSHEPARGDDPSSDIVSPRNAEPSSPSLVSPPVDFAEILQQVHLSYRPVDNAFVAAHGAYAVRADPHGVSITPRVRAVDPRAMLGPRGGSIAVAAPWSWSLREPVRRGTPATIQTVALTRGGQPFDRGTGAMNTPSAGVLTIDRGVAQERFVNRVGSIEQLWSFDQAPPGTGDLVIRVRISGESYAGSSEEGHHFIDPSTRTGIVYGPAKWVDAQGTTVAIPVEVQGDQLVLTVRSIDLDGSTYPARLDPTIFVEFELTAVQLGPSPYTESNPAIAFDGTNFLVVWEDTRTGASIDILGARVSQAGSVLDATSFPISMSLYDQTNPSVAYNGTEYLVVWSDNRMGNADVYGQRVRPNGTLDGGEFSISSGAGDQKAPDVAALGASWAVVWQDSRNGTPNIYSTLIGSSGIVQSPSGVALEAGTVQQQKPAVACSAAGCLAAWEHGPYWTQHPHAARLSAAGTPLDVPSLELRTSAGYSLGLDVAFDGSNYLAVWQDYGTGTFDVLGARVSSAGALLDAPDGFAIAAAPGHQVAPKVAFTGAQYWVVWEDTRSGPSDSRSEADVYGARVQTDGTVMDPAGIIVSQSVHQQALPATAAAGAQSLTVWEDHRDTVVGISPSDVFGTFVSSAGAVSSASGLSISRSADRQVTPVVATNGGSSFFLAFADSGVSGAANYDLIGVGLTYENQPVVASPTVISAGPGSQLAPDIDFDGTNFVVVWQDARNGDANYDIYAARVDAGFHLLDANGIAVSTAPGNQTRPSIAWNAGAQRHLIAWADERSGVSARDIYASRLAANGAVVDPSGIEISGASGQQSLPAVASDGSRWLIAWQDARNGGGTDDIHAAIADNAATPVLNPADLTVSAQPNAQQQVRVAFNGSSYLAIWQDARQGPTNSDLFAARIDTAGNLVDGALGIGIATSPFNEFRPTVAPTGTGYLFAWRQDRNGTNQTFDLVGQRFGPTMGAIDLAPFQIAAAAGSKDRVGLAVGANQLTLIGYQHYVADPAYRSERVVGRFSSLAPCPIYQAFCNGACVPIVIDPNNCGGCGIQCTGETACNGGVCSSSCLPGLTRCGNSCVDLRTDSAHCGSCTNACGAGTGCADSTCVNTIAVSAPPARCTGAGPVISVGDGLGGCVGYMAEVNFRWALCSCGALSVAAPMTTDEFDSTLGPYAPGQRGGSIGFEGTFSMTQPGVFGGTLWSNSSSGIGASVPGSVGIDVRTGGNLSGPLIVNRNAYVVGTVSPQVVVGGSVFHPTTIAPPCDCSAQQIVPVSAIVAAHRTPNNDNALIGLDPDVFNHSNRDLRLDLSCGNYYFSTINTNHAVTIYVHGRAALYVDGDISPSGPTFFALDPTAELDIFAAGTLHNAGGAFTIGSPYYPALSRTYVAGGAMFHLTNNTRIGGNIYAPSALLNASAQAEIYGSIFAASFAANSQTSVHYDRAVLTMGAECTGTASNTCQSCRDCNNQACVNGTCGLCTTDADCCAPLSCVQGSCVYNQ